MLVDVHLLKFYGDFICEVKSMYSFIILFQEYPPFLDGALIANVLDLGHRPSMLKSQVPRGQQSLLLEQKI